MKSMTAPATPISMALTESRNQSPTSLHALTTATPAQPGHCCSLIDTAGTCCDDGAPRAPPERQRARRRGLLALREARISRWWLGAPQLAMPQRYRRWAHRPRNVLPGSRRPRSVHVRSAWPCCGCCLFVDSDDEEDGPPESMSRLSASETSALAVGRDSELASHPSTGFSMSSRQAIGQLDLGEPRAPKNFPVSQLSNML